MWVWCVDQKEENILLKKVFDLNLIEEFHLSFNVKYKIKITSAKLDRLRKNHIYLYVQIL